MKEESLNRFTNYEIEQVLSGLKIRVSETQIFMKENKDWRHMTSEVNRQRRVQEKLIMKLKHELKSRKISSQNIDNNFVF